MFKLALAAPFLLLIPLSGAMAQAGGSYRGSCTNINQDGSMLTAECRGAGGQRTTTTIDTARCGRGGIANTNGRLTCGNVQGSATSAGRGRDYGNDGSNDGFQGRQHPRGQRYGAPDPQDYGYDAPPRRRYDQRPRPPVYGDDQAPDRGGYDQSDD